jgi:DHA3 family macrolide efflux protein-like MFS transporter
MMGIMLAPLNIAIGGWLPALVDPRQMGRVTSWNDPLLMLGQSVSLGLIALLYPRMLPLEVFYTALAIILLLVFIFYAFTLPRFERQLVPDAQNETALM